jgi:hypothetical protein
MMDWVGVGPKHGKMQATAHNPLNDGHAHEGQSKDTRCGGAGYQPPDGVEETTGLAVARWRLSADLQIHLYTGPHLLGL